MIWHWICHALGFDYGLPYGHLGAYNAWSGFLSDVGEVAIVGGLITIVRKHNCHVHGCWRVGRHPVAGTVHVVCRRHHPDGPLTCGELLRQATVPAEAPVGHDDPGGLGGKVDGLAGKVSDLAEAVQVVMAARTARTPKAPAEKTLTPKTPPKGSP